MADNVTANAGSGGAIFKTDEDAGLVHVPVSKLELGPNGTFDGYCVKGPGTEAAGPALLVTLPTDGTGRCDVQGILAHDAVDSADPIMLGAHALAHGTSLTGVAAARVSRLYCNRHGMPFVIAGHPKTMTATATVADSDGAQADTAIATIGDGNIAVVTRIAISTSRANTGNVSVKVGFGTATLATPGTTGITTILHEAKGMGPGEHIPIGDGSGILGHGANDEDLRYSCDDPVGGHVSISVSYYTIES